MAKSRFADEFHIQADLVRQDEFPVMSFGISGLAESFVFISIDDGSFVGDARSYAQHFPLFRCVQGDIAFNFRTGTDQTHVAAKHVPRFSQFIEVSFSKKLPRLCAARVLRANRDQSFLVGIGIHRPELQ